MCAPLPFFDVCALFPFFVCESPTQVRFLFVCAPLLWCEWIWCNRDIAHSHCRVSRTIWPSKGHCTLVLSRPKYVVYTNWSSFRSFMHGGCGCLRFLLLLHKRRW